MQISGQKSSKASCVSGIAKAQHMKGEKDTPVAEVDRSMRRGVGNGDKDPKQAGAPHRSPFEIRQDSHGEGTVAPNRL